MKDVGKNIRQKRRQIGLYQFQLAERVGCTQAHISGIENGKGISISLLVKIATALNCTPFELLQ